MKKKQSNNLKSISIDGKNIKLYSLEEVFAKVSKTKEFQRGYAAESQRLELARQLRDSRRAKRMTQKAVADKASMPQSVIARLESGEHSASIATLSKVAHALGKQIALVEAK